MDPGLKEDRYLKAVETKPTKGFRVVHHSVQTMTESDGSVDDSDNPRGRFLNEYALGKNGDVFPEGAGRLIKAGTKFNFNLHLHSIGEETSANVELGLKFYPRGYVPQYVENSEGVGRNQDLDIPANTDNVRSDGYFTLTRPARVLSFQPHMHNRGKAMCVEAIYPPTGTPAAGNTQQQNKVETLSCVDRYQFAWHVVYLYDDDAQPLLPAGTVLHVTGWHNNTAEQVQPDPTIWSPTDNDDRRHELRVDELGISHRREFAADDARKSRPVIITKTRRHTKRFRAHPERRRAL